jgi:hypothetical protein
VGSEVAAVTAPLASYCARCGAVTGRICVVCADEELFREKRRQQAALRRELRLMGVALVFALAVIFAMSSFYTTTLAVR